MPLDNDGTARVFHGPFPPATALCARRSTVHSFQHGFWEKVTGKMEDRWISVRKSSQQLWNADFGVRRLVAAFLPGDLSPGEGAFSARSPEAKVNQMCATATSHLREAATSSPHSKAQRVSSLAFHWCGDGGRRAL